MPPVKIHSRAATSAYSFLLQRCSSPHLDHLDSKAGGQYLLDTCQS